jgi:hypothetical protein
MHGTGQIPRNTHQKDTGINVSASKTTPSTYQKVTSQDDNTEVIQRVQVFLFLLKFPSSVMESLF